MGKMVGIYLNSEEQKQLEAYCQINNCTQYSVLKLGLLALLEEGLKKELQVSQDKPQPQTPQSPRKLTVDLSEKGK